MMMIKSALVFFFLFALGVRVSKLSAQPSVALNKARDVLQNTIAIFPDSTEVIIRSVTITGYKKTKQYIILREMPFRNGSKILSNHLFDVMEQARINIVNTQLFLEVLPCIEKKEGNSVDVVFDVKERWYIFPFPLFKLVDRNPNQWLIEQKGSLERVNYGAKLTWDNVSGRRDKLNITFVNGYTREHGISYEQPYADKKLEKGFLVGVYYKEGRQIAFATENNKQIFFPVSNVDIKGFVKRSIKAEVGFSIRKGVNHRHQFRLSYNNEKIADTISNIIRDNPSKNYLPYFYGNKTKQQFAEFLYSYQYYNVNNIVYPWKGFAFQGSFMQRGLGAREMNLWQFSGKAGRFFELNRTTSISAVGYYMVKVPFKQPVFNLGSMGYGEWFLRGLEYYVIDGVHAAMFKGTIRHELLNVNVPTPFTKNEKYRKIPFKIIAKLYGDIGASYLPDYTTNSLNNKFLYTYGAGFDVLSYYDFVARIEYSFNQLGQKGLFLHIRKDF
ncbi:MAG: POTRA domain-containing protein [Lacibacter sp.]